MNTYDARKDMLDLAEEAVRIIERLSSGSDVQFEDRQRLRRLTQEARALLADAGYPGETVWRGMQRATMGVDTSLATTDLHFWQDVHEELQIGIDTLHNLVMPQGRREADFHVVG